METQRAARPSASASGPKGRALANSRHFIVSSRLKKSRERKMGINITTARAPPVIQRPSGCGRACASRGMPPAFQATAPRTSPIEANHTYLYTGSLAFTSISRFSAVSPSRFDCSGHVVSHSSHSLSFLPSPTLVSFSWLPASPGPTPNMAYSLATSYAGQALIDGFNFVAIPDPTDGFVA